MKKAVIGGLLALAAGSIQAAQPQSAPAKPDAQQVERGRYLAVVGGCNDCHTAGFAPSGGQVPEKQWLTGDGTLGLRGPWGTTYATNLRLRLSEMTEAQWVHYAKALKARPPMPWFNLNQWTDADLRAFYRYLRHLGAAGRPVPAALAPDQEPRTPVVLWPAPPAAKR